MAADPPATIEPAREPRVFVLIPTHTVRHLETCLASFACHVRPPDGVVLTCDSDAPEIARTADRTWARVRKALQDAGRTPPPLIHTFRAHLGVPRLNQVRNNGLRALDHQFGLKDDDLIVVLDGDSILDGHAITLHAGAARDADVIIPFRVNLSEQVTASIQPQDFLQPGAGPGLAANLATPQDHADLAGRQKRYERQHSLRQRWGWLPRRFSPVKSHKPKVIGGHHAVKAGVLRAVNGYDEEFPGEGFDDDDLSRRLYMLKPPVAVAIRVTDILAFHLWHPTRRPYGVTESPSYARFVRADIPAFAVRGWQNPLDQPEPSVRVIADAPPLSGSSAAPAGHHAQA